MAAVALLVFIMAKCATKSRRLPIVSHCTLSMFCFLKFGVLNEARYSHSVIFVFILLFGGSAKASNFGDAPCLHCTPLPFYFSAITVKQQNWAVQFGTVTSCCTRGLHCWKAVCNSKTGKLNIWICKKRVAWISTWAKGNWLLQWLQFIRLDHFALHLNRCSVATSRVPLGEPTERNAAWEQRPDPLADSVLHDDC